MPLPYSSTMNKIQALNTSTLFFLPLNLFFFSLFYLCFIFDKYSVTLPPKLLQ